METAQFSPEIWRIGKTKVFMKESDMVRIWYGITIDRYYSRNRRKKYNIFLFFPDNQTWTFTKWCSLLVCGENSICGSRISG